MCNKLPFFLNLLFLIFSISFKGYACFLGYSQECSLSISGYVLDSGVGKPLEDVHVHLEETYPEKGANTNAAGFFEIKNLCPGEYHLGLSHIGCDHQHVFIDLKKDTLLYLEMNHSINTLGDIVVKGSQIATSTQNTEALNQQKISDNANQSLSNMIEALSGVSTLKNGSGISKPVIHGVYGNRLTILNNGVAQSGQQWGNDHSPEIDPLVANSIKVIKGVSTLEYMGSNLGGLVLVQPKKIGNEPHLHGKGSYFFESNGWGNGLNLQLQQYHPLVAWKINGTLKKIGDRKSSNYFLRNTGSQEANLALQLEKTFSEKLFLDFYASSFNTELGVLRGSHISNVTNLKAAFSREMPFLQKKNLLMHWMRPNKRYTIIY